MLGESAKKFLEENVTTDERGNAHLTQKKYQEFMAANGITKEMLDAKAEVDKELINGSYLYASDELAKKVKKAKSDGNDPTKEVMSLSIGIPSGSINMDIIAAKSYPVPRNPGESITKTNVCRLDIRQTRFLEKETVSACEADMAKLLGIEI